MTTSSANSQTDSRTSGPQQRRQSFNWLWLALWAVLLIGSANLCLWAVVWLTRIPPLPQCEEVTGSASKRDRIYCAEVLIKSGTSEDLARAIQITQGWPESHSEAEEAASSLKVASEKLLFLANRQAQRGSLEAATALAAQIPLDTPLRQAAQGAIFSWRQEWEQGKALEERIQQAIRNRRWEQGREALQTLQTLKLDYWLRDRHGYWQERLQQEKTAWEQLESARALAVDGAPEELQQAIETAQQVAVGSRVWREAEADISRWSKTLIAYALEQWQQGDVSGAIATVQTLPPDPQFSPEAQDLIRFSHAQRLARSATPAAPNYTPSYPQLFALMDAIRAAEAISADSPFHGEAEVFARRWRAQLQDLSRLQAAHTIAAIGQEATYRIAIESAQEVASDRPRRSQGQTLVAHWRKQIERLQDRPILAAAERLARGGTIADLEAAMAKAADVELGRALRIDAQTRIADWQREIQVIEDRPIIDEAIALAADGDRRQAIEVARQLQSDRALYDRAQSLIADWTRQIQIAEDRPVLAEAKDLAYSGSLTAAINLASSIGPGRALYGEAQRAIALWEAERAYIWSVWETEAAAEAEATEPEAAPAETEPETP